MPMTFLDFGTLQWGAGEHGDGLTLAENVIPAFGVKRPLEEWADDEIHPVTDVFNSIFGHSYPAGSGTSSYVGDQITEFHGSKTKIRVHNADGTWSDISRGGGYAAAGEPAAWSGASWGNDPWMTNYLDDLQIRAGNAGNFANGTGASVFKPKARFLAVVKNYMMAFDLNGSTSDSFAWSVPGNPAVWDAAASGGGGTGRITSRPGQIMGAVGGEFARVWKRRSLHVLHFTGDVLNPWREDVVSASIGTNYPGSIVAGEAGAVYFIGNDNYVYRQEGLSAPERISPYQVAAYLQDLDFSPAAISRAKPTTMAEESLHIQSGYHEGTGMVIWIYRGAGDASALVKTKGIALSTITLEFTTLDTQRSRAPLTVATFGGLPSAVGGNETLAGMIGTWTDSGSSFRFNFTGTDAFPFRLRTRRQALALSGHEEPLPVRIKGALPVISTEATGDVNRVKFEGFPPNLSFAVIVSNDPNFQIVLDGATEINPRRTIIRADASVDPDTGLFPFVEDGAWQVFELSLPSDLDILDQGLLMRAMPGFWVQWEEPS